MLTKQGIPLQIGLFEIGSRQPSPYTGRRIGESERLHQTVRIATHAEKAGFDLWAVGEHHNPPFVSSSAASVLAFVAAQTRTLRLSTSTTLITTNDPVRIAEEFATLQHLSGGRVDLMLGRGNTPQVYPWFGQDVQQGIPLALENYALLRRLWDEEVVTWRGRFRAPLTDFTSIPRPLDGVPPQVWHGSVRSPEIAEQAAAYGDAFFVNNLFMSMDYFARFVDFYRQRYEDHGHGVAAEAIVGAGAGVYVRHNSQDALTEYRAHWAASPMLRGQDIDHMNAETGFTAGSPQQVIDKVLRFPHHFGTLRRLLFSLELGGVDERTQHEQIDLLGAEVLPVLRRELAGAPPAVGTPAGDLSTVA